MSKNYEIVSGISLGCSKEPNETLYNCKIDNKKIKDVGHIDIQGSVVDKRLSVSLNARNPNGNNYLSTTFEKRQDCAIFFDFGEAYADIVCGDERHISTSNAVYNMTESDKEEMLKKIKSVIK